ncbi:MAG: hypothetical protein ACOC2Y_03615 [Spirochaetota bacterium]
MIKRTTTGRLRLVALGALVVGLTAGCVDVVQYISGSGSDINVYLRLTLQKAAFEMANEFSDDPEDPDEMFEEEFELDRDTVLEEMPPGIDADYRRVNDEFEYGFELSYSAPRSTLAALRGDEAAFVPRVTRNGMTIPLAPGNEAGEGAEAGEGGQGEEFAAAFLGGAKYRVFVSKMLVSRIRSARIASGGVTTEVTVIELPDVWMVQFPVSLWLMSDDASVLEISF